MIDAGCPGPTLIENVEDGSRKLAAEMRPGEFWQIHAELNRFSNNRINNNLPWTEVVYTIRPEDGNRPDLKFAFLGEVYPLTQTLAILMKS